MKKLLITLLLISPFSFADWGDVYYCQMTTYSGISLEGKRTDYKLEKFTFKLDKTKNAMVFGKKGYFKGTEMTPREGFLPLTEIWFADGKTSMAWFEKGNFLYTRIFSNVRSVSADCEKF